MNPDDELPVAGPVSVAPASSSRDVSAGRSGAEQHPRLNLMRVTTSPVLPATLAWLKHAIWLGEGVACHPLLD